MKNKPVGQRASPWRLFALALLSLTLHGGCDRDAGTPSAQPGEEANDSAVEHARKHLDPNYVCPMHPQIVRDEPGSCPICGMDLVEKVLERTGDDHPPVTLSPAVVQNLGVRTAAVKRGTLWKFIRTQGTVTHDEERILKVHPRAEGWIETLYVRTSGERVKRGDDLADYLSPSILWAQVEFLAEAEEKELSSFGSRAESEAANPVRLMGAHELLRYMKVPERYIKAAEAAHAPRSLIPIKAPQGGVITQHSAREGSFVTPLDTLFTIVDLSRVWVMVDIFEHQLAWVRPGLSAEITSPAYPGRTWEGTVDFIYPEVHPRARTLQARLHFDNPDELLMPNMFVEVVIYGGPKKNVLVVPREAVIVTGEREAVIKVLGGGRFEPVEVVTGLWREGSVEVLSGLEEGEDIVVSGQFLIDSESSLQGSFTRMGE